MAQATTARSRILYGVAGVVSFLAGLAAVVLAVHIAFVVFDANPTNSIVTTSAKAADRLAMGFKDLFTPRSPKRAVIINYGLAAIAYLVVGHVIAKIIRRAGMV